MRAVVLEMPPHWLKERQNTDRGQWDEMWDGVLHIPLIANRIERDLEAQLNAYLIVQWAYPFGNRAVGQVNLTTTEDEANWTNNYRIPDLVLLTPKNFHIDKCEYMVGAPDVVVEIHTPGDEAYDKLPFYAELGVEEVWIIHRDKKTPEIYLLQEDGSYEELPAEKDGWHRSPAIGFEMKRGKPGKLAVRMKGKPRTKTEIPPVEEPEPMPRTQDYDDDDEWEDDSDDDDETIPCPHCKKDIYDGAEQCPHCGQYISEEDAPREAKPLWIVIGAIICLVVAIMWAWRG